MQTNWTEEHSKALREFFESGMSYARIADAINALHIVHGEDLLGWLDEEQEYEERVAANCPYLGQGHRRWLRYVRAEIDAALDALDRL